MEHELGYPSTSVCTGPSTSYLLFEAPLIYLQDSTKKKSEISEQFSDDLYFASGVMLSGNLFSHSDVSSYVRLHLGSDPANLEEVMRRFKEAGLHYQMNKKFDGLGGTQEKLTTKLWNMISS
jgi:hypothetical protein